MPRPRFEKLSEEKRARILTTSAKEFAAHGYDGASLNHILSEAGISKGAAYYYFDDKADLFATVLGHYWQRVAGRIDVSEVRLDAAGFWDWAAEMYRQGLVLAEQEPWLLPLFKGLFRQRDVPGLPAGVAAALSEVREWTRALVVRGQEVGAVRSDVPLELLLELLFAVDDVGDRWLMDNWDRVERAERERVSATMFAMVRRMLERPAEACG